MQRRREAEQDARRDREPEREQRAAPVHDRPARPGCSRRTSVSRTQMTKSAERARGERQQHALGHELPDDAPARRTQRQTHRDLPPPRDGQAGQQRAHVRAGDQQDEHRNQTGSRRGRRRPAFRPTAGSSCRRAAGRRPWTRRRPPTGAWSAARRARRWPARPAASRST